MRPRVSEGMSRAFKARSWPCPRCGRKTIQPKRRSWEARGNYCRWCGYGRQGAKEGA